MNSSIHQKLAIQFITLVSLTIVLVVSEKYILQSNVLLKINYAVLVVLPVMLMLLLNTCIKATTTLPQNQYLPKADDFSVTCLRSEVSARQGRQASESLGVHIECMTRVSERSQQHRKFIWEGYSKTIFYMGAFMIVGCSMFDVTITLIQSPDLAREANILVTSLFAHQAPLSLVYCYGLYTQIMLSLIGIVFWSLFLKALPIMIHELRATSIFDFLNKLYFGKNATFKSTLLGKYDPLFFNASLVPSLMGIFLHRIYCGLDWLNLAPYCSMYSSELVMLAANVLFIVYVRNKINKKALVAIELF